MIFADFRANGFMTERNMKILKNRANKEQRDCFDYTFGAINNGYGVRIDEEWANKEIKWLKSLLKNNGEPKSWENIRYRELEIIQNAMPEDLRFMGFYDAGRGWCRNYIPVYNCGGMEYFCDCGNIKMIG